MRLCIPTEGDGGLDARLSEHFGRAAAFAIVDTATGSVETLENPERNHEHGRCAVTTRLADYRPDAVACRGIGRNASTSLEALGIEVYRAEGPRVRDVVDQVRRPPWRLVPAQGTCREP